MTWLNTSQILENEVFGPPVEHHGRPPCLSSASKDTANGSTDLHVDDLG